LTQRYGEQVARQVPGIDGILGTRRWMDILDVVHRLRNGKHPEPVYHLPEVDTVGRDDAGTQRVTVQGASAYLKIADGCRRPCAFCAIPLIKGTAVSRPIEAILADARALQDLGVHEINLIAQDTTDYGHDLGMKNGLATLLRQLCAAVPDVPWLRILYAYPGYVTDELIEVMATHEQVVPYLDMPLQHAHPAMLRRMRRPANIDWVYRTLEKMRNAMPDLALRTTFIVGYPGETEEEFNTLLDFMREIRFDRVGAFQFSFEPGTASEPLGDPIPPEIKQARWEQLMETQQAISLERNQQFVGQTLDVLIEGRGDGISLGRSYRDAPEIDGLVIVEEELPIGTLTPVRITGALPYDLTGVVDRRRTIDDRPQTTDHRR
ncbi:MAG: 30S ribosomal protein S12 methylthiotransferase RimO, partial [Anaerolineae bacterium]